MMWAALVFSNIRKMPAYMLTDLSIEKVKIVDWDLFPSLCTTKMSTYYKHICIVFILYNAPIASKSAMNVKHKCLDSKSAMNVLYFNYCILYQSMPWTPHLAHEKLTIHWIRSERGWMRLFQCGNWTCSRMILTLWDYLLSLIQPLTKSWRVLLTSYICWILSIFEALLVCAKPILKEIITILSLCLWMMHEKHIMLELFKIFVLIGALMV